MELPHHMTITHRIRRMQAGDVEARDELVALVYGELRARAAQELQRHPGGNTLQPTALANEIWLKLQAADNTWQDRGHFMGVAARAMRNLLIDHARRRRQVDLQSDDSPEVLDVLDGLVKIYEPEDVDLIALHEALKALEQVDATAVRIIELRYFLGATHDEAAQAVGVSPSTAGRSYDYAKRWLKKRLED